jgi:hypothetical protein
MAKAAARGSGAAAFATVGPERVCQYQPLACQNAQAPVGLP